MYIRRVNDTDPRKGTLGILYIVFDGNKFDELFAELGTVLETRILIREGEKVLYTSFDAKNGELEQMENTAQLLTQKDRMPGRKGLVKWEYGIENLGIHIVFYDTLERLEENVRALSRLTGTFIWLTGIVILAASLFFPEPSCVRSKGCGKAFCRCVKGISRCGRRWKPMTSWGTCVWPLMIWQGRLTA